MSGSRWNNEHVTPLDFKTPNPWDGVDNMALKRERLLSTAREASIRDKLEYALEENKQLEEQVQHLAAFARLFDATCHEANALRKDLKLALEENKQLKEQVQHLLAENEEKRAQLRNFSQRLVQCKWQLAQLTPKR